MPFSLKGYVLEKPRVGTSNSAFTASPDNFVSGAGAFNAAYPANESAPRTEYLVLVDPQDGNFSAAKFWWTKNEVTQHFDFDGMEQRFKLLPGRALEVSKVLVGPDANTTERVAVVKPFSTNLAQYPFRISVGSAGSGTTLLPIFVANDASFGAAPPAGSVKVSLDTGNLHWNPADIALYTGQHVRTQRQLLYPFKESKGLLGEITTPLLLNPIPVTGQVPILRFGYGFPLDSVERANEASFSVNPTAGTVEWAADTGRLKFNTSNIAANAGKSVYYDGIVFARGLQLTSHSLGAFPVLYSIPVSVSNWPVGETDIVFSVGSYRFPQVEYVTVAPTDFGRKGTVRVLVTGLNAQAWFSLADTFAFAGQPLSVIFGDFLVERGVSLRFFRNPVNLDGANTALKDFQSQYQVTNASLANPIIGSPQVYVPAVPIDQIGVTLQVKIQQGTGTYVTNNFQRLDTTSPPSGLGYYIDFEGRLFNFAQRKNNLLVPMIKASGVANLPDPLVLPSNVKLELETTPGSNVFNQLTIGTDCLFERFSGTVTFTQTDGNIVVRSNKGSASGTSFTDTAVNFVGLGVQPEDALVTASGDVFIIKGVTTNVLTLDTSAGVASPVAYEIRTRREILVDRFFQEVILADPATRIERVRKMGAITNSPRLSVGIDQVTRSRFRFGLSTLSATVAVVTGSFTAPASLAQGAVEIDSVTGEVNFSQTDVTGGGDVYQVLRLQQQVDYKMSPVLGFIDFDQRMLAFDEGLATYTPLGTVSDTVPSGTLVTEPMTWLVRKEITQDHIEPTSTTTFNVLNRRVALQPTPSVFRGGRPQVIGEQCLVSPGPPSSVTFLTDEILSDALPHGATLNPDERVYVDYFIYDAIGGEKNTTVLQPPMVVAILSIRSGSVINGVGSFSGTTLTDTAVDFASVGISAGDVLSITSGPLVGQRFQVTAVSSPTSVTFQPSFGTPGTHAYKIVKASFTLLGDWTGTFKTNQLLRIEQEEVYLLAGSSYNPTTNITTIGLVTPQVFRSDYTNPKIHLASGETPLTATGLPPYFVVEPASFDPVPRGSNKAYFFGDRTVAYRSGTVLAFTDAGGTYLDFYGTTGAKYDPTKDRTEVTLTSGTARECTMSGGAIPKHSVRALLESSATTTQTLRAPVLSNEYKVYRKIAGQPGSVLTSPLEYTIDDSGAIKVATALLPHEEIGIFYTGYRTIEAGLNLRASYTSSIVPTASNGILNQVLLMDYGLFSPDVFFYRVETLTTYRGELAQKYENDAKAASPSGGPNTSNASQPKLYEQGRPSVFFDEGKYYNEDTVARPTLKWYNDAVNLLEDFLQDVDGRIVGNTRGRFKFDGTTGQQVDSYANATNHIDDYIKISDGPFIIGLPLFTVTFGKTYARFWQPSAFSRIYLTQRLSIGAAVAATNPGDTTFDLQAKKVSSVINVRQRPAYALVTKDALAGATSVTVDDADGNIEGVRPAFVANMKVQVMDRTGIISFLPPGAKVTTATATTVNFDLPALLPIPAGATIFQVDGKVFTPLNYGVDGDKGVLVKTEAPDGLPSPLDQLFGPPDPGLPMQCFTVYSNTDTSPNRAPVFDGKVLDDDGSIALPLQSPSFLAEYPFGGNEGTIASELAIIGTPSGTLRTKTQASYEGTGSLDVTKTQVTATAAFPSPVPKVHDLLRILNGLNGATSFRRITAVSGTTLTVDTAFTTQDTGFAFTVTVSPVAASGTATISGSTLTDLTASFLTTAKVGQTIVIFLGAGSGERRQITGVTSGTVLAFSPSLTLGVSPYRIEKALGTYNGPEVATLVSTINTSLAILDTNQPPANIYSERKALENFFDLCFTNLSTGTGAANASTLVDPSATFLSAGVNGSHFIFIRSGVARGVFKIASINSETQITLSAPFPANDPAAIYRVVSSFGVGYDGLASAFNELDDVDTLITSGVAIQANTGTVSVVKPGPVVDANAYANALLTSALNAREAVLTARSPTTSIDNVSQVLTGSDRLYDKRFIWVDARTNVEKGILPLQSMAVQTRKKSQADILKSLTKLLAVR